MEITKQILDILLPAVATALAALVSFGVTVLIDWLREKITSEKAFREQTELLAAMRTATEAVERALGDTMQTFVEEYKASGKWDEAAERAAKALTTNKALELMGESTRKILDNLAGSAIHWIHAELEDKLLSVKAKREGEIAYIESIREGEVLC